MLIVPVGTPEGLLTVTATGAGFSATGTTQVVDAAGIGISIEHPTLYRGQVQVGHGTGYAPGTVVHGYMNSTPSLDLGTQIADADGEVTFTWTIPQNAAIDTHVFSLRAAEYPDQSITFRVLATPAPGLPGTGADVAFAGFAAAGLVLLGVLLLGFARNRRQRRMLG